MSFQHSNHIFETPRDLYQRFVEVERLLSPEKESDPESLQRKTKELENGLREILTRGVLPEDLQYQAVSMLSITKKIIDEGKSEKSLEEIQQVTILMRKILGE